MFIKIIIQYITDIFINFVQKVTKPTIIIENGVKSDAPALTDTDLNTLDPLGW